MDIKIFSANHSLKTENSFEEIQQIEKPELNLSVALFAGFPKANEKVKNIFHNIKQIVKQSFNDDNNEDYFEKLEETLKTINDTVRDDIQNLDENTLREGGFLIALFADNTLYFTSCGTPEVYFIRRGKFTIISEGIFEQSDNGDIFTNVANGELKDEDRIIITTTRLLRHATGNQIAEASQNGVTEAIEAIKFILPDNEALTISIFHIKSLKKLPFNEDKKDGFFKKFHKKDETKGVFKVSNNIWEQLSNSWANKNTAIVFAGLIALVLIAVFFGLVSERKSNEIQEQYRTEIEQIRSDLKSAEDRFLEGKKEEANNLLTRVEESANKINEEGYFRKEIMQILEAVQDKKAEINGVIRLSGAARVISDVGDNVQLKGIFEYNSDYYPYNENQTFQILAANGEIKNTYNLTQNEAVIDGAQFESKDQILFLTEKGKIVEWNEGEIAFASTNDEQFKNAIELETFSKYLYLLDPNENQVWKYERKDSGFTSAQEYNLNTELKNAISFAIDGNIFVLNSEGKILKMYRGLEEDYKITNAPNDNFKNATKIFTNDKLENIYLLIPEEKSVLVFYKGQNEAYYQNQVIIEDVEQITDFWIDPETDRMIFTDQSKIYEVKMP